MRRSNIGLGIAIALSSAGGVVLASVADDFKDASNRVGCEAIPYSSERSSCMSGGRDVDDWCKNPSKPWSCVDLDPGGLARNIENVNRKISDLKKEKDDLEYKRNNSNDDKERAELESKIREKKDQIDELQAKVEAWTRQIDSERHLARDRQDVGERCVANRLAVQKIFAGVKARVQSESDPDAKQYVSKFVDIYTAAERGHQEAIDSANRGIETCKGLR